MEKLKLAAKKNGYRLPFETIPSGNVLINNMSSLRHPKFVEEAIIELFHSYRVVEVDAPPDVVNPLPVRSAQWEEEINIIFKVR